MYGAPLADNCHGRGTHGALQLELELEARICGSSMLPDVVPTPRPRRVDGLAPHPRAGKVVPVVEHHLAGACRVWAVGQCAGKPGSLSREPEVRVKEVAAARYYPPQLLARPPEKANVPAGDLNARAAWDAVADRPRYVHIRHLVVLGKEDLRHGGMMNRVRVRGS